MGEGYVRPPLVAREPVSRRVAAWRVRLAVLVVLAVVAVVVFLIVRAVAPGESQNPGVGLGRLDRPAPALQAPAGQVAAG